MADEELQLRAQRSLQEYEDAVENLDPNFAELGRKCVAVLESVVASRKEKGWVKVASVK